MKRLIKQAIAFVGLSGLGWLLDFGVYTLLGMFSNKVEINNMISSWVGVTFVFIFSTRSVFKSNSRIPLKVKYLIYIIYQIVLIFFMSKLLGYFNALILNYVRVWIVKNLSSIISKILITPFTMVLNFFVMKGLIEKL